MQRSQSKELSDDARKVFITNIDGLQPEEAVQNELKRLFSRYGNVTKLNVKKNKNGLYSFAFLQFQKAEEAVKAISELDQYELFGKRMRVRQDRQSQGCFHCKKSGHFARQCPQNKEREGRSNDQSSRQRESYRDYKQVDDRYDKQRYYREERHHKTDKYERRMRDDIQDRRERRDRRQKSRSYSYQYQRRGGRNYSSKSDSASRDHRYRRHSPRHDRYYDERRRRRREHREDRRGGRDEYYRGHRSYSSRSYSQR